MKWVREKVKKISALILIKKSSGREKGAKTSIIKAPIYLKTTTEIIKSPLISKSGPRSLKKYLDHQKLTMIFKKFDL